MVEHLEHDPKRIESLRMQIDSLIQNYLNQKPIPGIADFAEVFGAESYVVEMKRQKAIKIDIKSFREEMVTRLLEQSESSGVEVILPKVFEMLSQTILPPDEGEIKTGSGEGIEKKKYIPRTQYLIELLSEMGESYEIVGGKNTSDMMRERTYFIFYLPNSEKAIFVNNEEGNTTFIIYHIASKQEAIDLAALTKDEIRAKEKHDHPYAQIDWTGDGEGWKGKLLGYLTGPVPGGGKDKEKQLKTRDDDTFKEKDIGEYETAPDGWMRIKGIANEVKKSPKWVNLRIDEVLSVHPEWGPKTFLYTSGKGSVQKALHYPVELIFELKQQADLLKKAPPDWFTSLNIVEKIGKDRTWIGPRIKDLISKHPEWEPKMFISPGNNEGLHYPPELVNELEKQASLIKEAPKDWLTVKGISDKTNKSESWVVRQVKIFLKEHPDCKPEMYLDVSKKNVLHYPPELIQHLAERSEKNENAPEGWKTAKGISDFILETTGKNEMWTTPRVKKLVKDNPGWEPRIYLDSATTRELLHYPPELFNELYTRAQSTEKAPPDWFTIGGIAEKVGRSHWWTKKQVDHLLPRHSDWQSRLYLDAQNKEAQHYPSEFLAEIKKISEKEAK